MAFRASTPSSASETEYPLKERERRSDSRTARSSSTTSIRTATSVIPTPETDLRGAPGPQDAASALVEIDQAEPGGLEQPARHLVLLARDGHVHQSGGLGLPLRAPATGVRARHPALGHSHDVHLLAW